MQSLSLKAILIISLIAVLTVPAVADIYYSEIVFSDDIDNQIEFRITPSDYQAISAEINGRMWPVSQFSDNEYSVTGFGKLNSGQPIKVLYEGYDVNSLDKVSLELIGTNGDISYNRFPGLALDLIPLQSVTDTLRSGIAGDSDAHKIGFDISTNQIMEKGEIWITFEAGFDAGGLVSLDSISYSDDDPANNGSEPTITSVSVITRTVILKLDSGTPASPNSRVNVEIKPVNNSIIAGDYSVTVQTLDSLGALVHIPTSSNAFILDPDVLNSVAVTPGGDMNIPSDSIVVFSAAGHDQYGNAIDGLTYTWAITVDSCGTINNGTFQAKKLGDCYITATTGGFADSSGVLTVEASDLDRFAMTGYPASVQAGQVFPIPIALTAYDVNDNIIYDLADSIYFFSSDDSAAFTYDSDNWLDIDTGQVSIPGNNFTLKLAGSQTITVTNGTQSTTSSSITVSSTLIDDFSFSAVGDQTAGVSFNLSVTGAVDQYGNPASGNVIVDDVVGGNSPDGDPPVLNNITVTNGSGQAGQLLTNAVASTLEGVGGSATVQTNSFTVNPGVVGRLILTGYPDEATAGEQFTSDPLVTVKDIFGNLKTNYTGTIHFKGPETVPSPYTFVTPHAGSHTFPDNQFAFQTAGLKRLYVFNADSSLADTSSAIDVSANIISSFSFTALGSVTAGSPFSISVSNALDQYGNSASGTITVTDSSGAGNSPDGSSPSLNDIIVNNGSGSANQILVDVGAAIIRGISEASTVQAVNITVNPAAGAQLVLTDTPDTITAGLDFSTQSIDPTVTVLDSYGNIATGYGGTVSFNNIENRDGPHTFIPADLGVYRFDGGNFSFEAAGARKIIATDGVLADTSSIVEVYPAAITSYDLNAPPSVVAGTAFTLSVANAVDQFSNDASGTVVITDSLGAGGSPDGSMPSLNNIEVSGGVGSAQQVLVDSVAAARLKGAVNGVVRGTSDITVAPANANELVLSNYPDTITAGQAFPSPANDPLVTLKDAYGNLATTYDGTVTLSNADSPDLDHDFVAGHDGTFAFDGDLIVFNTGGWRTLIVSDDTFGLADTSSPIQVLGTSSISSFDITAPSDADAGAAFSVNISNARDQFNNLTSGTVTIQAVSGAGNAPDGSSPSFHDVSITNGVGSASQVLVLTGTARLRGVAGSFADTTGNITVSPGTPDKIEITDCPESVTAGNGFSTDPIVTIYDSYENIATDYTGEVTFSGIATTHAPYTFIGGDAGQHTFPGSSFIPEESGIKRVIVTEDQASLVDTSEQFTVYPNVIAGFDFGAVGGATAGVPFSLSVSNAVDQFDNAASGTITVVGYTGAGNAPDGSVPSFNNIAITNGSGSGDQVLVLTGNARIRGFSGSAADTTSTFTVAPGAFGELRITNTPDTVTAGSNFSTDPVVTSYDLFGNLATNYTGTITFDGINQVPSDYPFVGGDNGQHSFLGSGFSPHTAGFRRLIVRDDAASISDTSNPIQVYPDTINSFSFAAIGSQTAGVPFVLTVSNAIDAYGNNTSGVIDIDTVGSLNSPNGDSPIINDINVTDGSGSAQQTLVLTGGSVQLRGSYSTLEVTTNTFAVNPGVLGELDVAVSSPQISGVPFTAPSTITAIDVFGNDKTNFSAAGNNITITASNGGDMADNILDEDSDFTNELADLNALGVTYSGAGGQVTFTAAAQSGITGESNVVQIGSIRADDISLDLRQVVSGDTARGTVRVTNLGNVAATITDIIIKTDPEMFSPSYTPPLGSVPGGTDQTYDFKFVVNTLSSGSYPLTMIVNANYSSIITSDTLIGRDTLIIVTESNLTDISGSLTPDTISSGSDYSLAFEVINNGEAALNIADSSYITFTDGSETYMAELAQNSYVGAGDQTYLYFNSASVNAAFIPNSYSVSFQIYGYDIHRVIDDLITITDDIMVQSPSNITYLANLTPLTLLTGAEVRFSARVSNSAQADLIINPDQTKITFSDVNENQYIAYIDTAAAYHVEVIEGGGDTTLTFVRELLLPGFTAGNYTPTITIAGTQNQRSYSANVPTESILILQPGEVRMDSLYTVAPNSPKVNANQEFTIHGFISNLGNEIVDSVHIVMSTDGGSTFNDTVDVGTINSLDGAAFDYTVTAASSPNLLEAFYVEIEKAVNRLSHDDSPIATPLDNGTVAIIENDAIFELDTLYLTDDSLSTGQAFTVYTRVVHTGSESYDGTNQLIIDLGGDSEYLVADSLPRDFSIGQLVSWNVTAPETERNATTVTVSFNGEIVDLNDSTTALGPDSVLNSTIQVTSEAAIAHRPMLVSPSGATDSVLSTGQSLVVSDSLFPTGNVATSYGRLTLPEGFSSSDPLTQELSGNAVNWSILASEQEKIDSLGFECWTIDSNTGDIAYSDTTWIRIEVESKATLSLNSTVTSPPSAMDRIISPGTEFTLEATASNIGNADVGTGELTLSIDTDRFTVTEDLTRTFSAGTPVVWTIFSPEEQILDGVVVSVLMPTVANDLNTGLPSVVLNDSSGMEIIIKRELPDLVLQNPTPLGGAAVAGMPLDIYRLTFHNSIDITNDQIGMYTFGFRLKSDGVRISPSDVVSASVLTINDEQYAGVLNDSVVTFSIDPIYIIEPDSSVLLTINVTPVANPTYRSFSVNFQSSDIFARVIIGGSAEQQIEVVLPDGEDFLLDGETLATLEGSFLTSTKVNQNPYIAANGNLSIGYILENDATLDITIYNVTGDVVWEYTANSTNGYGTAGPHYDDDVAIPWDGRNSRGDKVLSGVYYIFVTNNATGQTTNLKVAVVW